MSMQMLEGLLGGERKQHFQDFARRYDEGPPYHGIDDDEVMDRYGELEQHIPADMYEESAYESFQRLSPQERRQFGQYLRQQARQQQMQFPDFDHDGVDDRFEDPRFMAQMAGRMHRQQPGMFGNLASGGRMQQRRRGQQQQRRQKQSSPLDNPLAKAALAGIAAVAAKKMFS